jgi:diguanylate cyclase (GGDEF)-like protein/PAS domain S-box-containing protein
MLKKFFTNSNYVIAIGSSLMIALMIALAVSAMSHMSAIKASMETITHERSQRIEVLTNMRRIIRERSMTMYAIYLTADPFDKDVEFMHFNAQAEQFIKLRLDFERAGALPQQAEKFKQAMQLINKTAPLQEDIVDKMIDGKVTNVYQLMSAVDLPMEKRILALFDDLIKIERDYTRDAVASAQQEYDTAYLTMILIGCVVFVLSVLITALVMRRTGQIEGALFEAKEQAEVTLHAIGDAVITTDARGKVVYLNPVAEQLTGWSTREAVGRPLAEVYHLRDEQGQESVQHPAYAGELDGQAMGLHQHSILTSRDEVEYIVKDTASPLCKDNGEVFGSVIVSRDVTHERKLTQQLTWQACHDSLTGLVNRREFENQLERLLLSGDKDEKHNALLYMDLDQFKLVNDTCGHIAGDELLKQLTVLLRSSIRGADTLARLGGDEFGLVLEGCPIEQAQRIADELIQVVRDFRFVWKGKIFTLGVSVGLAMMDGSTSANAILSAADAACFIAKDKGRNRVWIHQMEDEDVAQRHGEMEWASRINHALEQDSFTLYQQKATPIAAGNQGDYIEFLLRMVDDDGGIIAPMAFIPAAERYGTMVAIDRWVVHHALGWLYRTFGDTVPQDVYAINLSGQSIGDSAFLQFCVEELERSQMAPQCICFEITETAAISNWSHASEFVAVLKSLGCRFALDDFGSGMSSFGYLKNLAVDYIKIDGAFVADMLKDPVDHVMVSAINQIGQVMGSKTIAEFVEEKSILNALKELGVDYAQGYGVHHPDQVEAFALSSPLKDSSDLDDNLKLG